MHVDPNADIGFSPPSSYALPLPPQRPQLTQFPKSLWPPLPPHLGHLLSLLPRVASANSDKPIIRRKRIAWSFRRNISRLYAHLTESFNPVGRVAKRERVVQGGATARESHFPIGHPGGVAGFEPASSSPRAKCSAELNYTPVNEVGCAYAFFNPKGQITSVPKRSRKDAATTESINEFLYQSVASCIYQCQ